MNAKRFNGILRKLERIQKYCSRCKIYQGKSFTQSILEKSGIGLLNRSFIFICQMISELFREHSFGFWFGF